MYPAPCPIPHGAVGGWARSDFARVCGVSVSRAPSGVLQFLFELPRLLRGLGFAHRAWPVIAGPSVSESKNLQKTLRQPGRGHGPRPKRSGPWGKSPLSSQGVA